MALELLRGFKWDHPEASEERELSLTIGELFILLGLNQDYALANKNIPEGVALKLQEKLVKVLR